MEKHSDPIARLETLQPVKKLLEELRAGLFGYWELADSVLGQGGVTLKVPREAYFSLERNFFSLLFLYSFYRAGIPKKRRILYASTLQCLRGMVTGCDNLLEDEYKKTLDTDIPETGFRFRSVIDIMVSDRVLFQLLLDACFEHGIGLDKLGASIAGSLKTLTQSGVQEAGEEAGITTILSPDDLLQTIHHYKTGLLFKCPWDIPLTMETVDSADIAPMLEGLYLIGMGCQIMDDMVDFMSDLKGKRHNYLVSLVYYSPNPGEKDRLRELVERGGRQRQTAALVKDFPDSLVRACETAHDYLDRGLNLLFSESHRYLVEPSIRFLEKRIGVAHLMSEC